MKITIKKPLSSFGALAITVGILLLTITSVLWPLGVIWALNTLFTLSIPFSFWTWLAVWIILVSLQVARISNK